MRHSQTLLPLALCCLLAPSASLAQPVEYVRTCPTEGPGYARLPGTEDCAYLGNDGTAIANSLEDPDLVPGESVGLRANVGFSGGVVALGVTGAMVLSPPTDAGPRVTLSGGLGTTSKQKGGRVGLQLSW